MRDGFLLFKRPNYFRRFEVFFAFFVAFRLGDFFATFFIFFFAAIEINYFLIKKYST
jgi:hypothetical protein